MVNLGENFALSETHIFNPNLINEFRFGYNYGHFAHDGPNANSNIAAALGMGGLPYGSASGYPENGGLPRVSLGAISAFGTPQYDPSDEHENVYQILDNVTKIIGNHSLKFGVSLQNIRFSTLQVASSHGMYTYNGLFTSKLKTSFTGYGTADFLANQMNSATISAEQEMRDVRWYRSAYFQDDWKVTPRITLNLGLRYDYVQPYREIGGHQANFEPIGPAGPGSGAGVYLIPTQSQGATLAPWFTQVLAANNIQLKYSDNLALVGAQKTNFAPRFGLAYNLNSKTVLRGGFGIFFGGLENRGGNTNIGNNYPFQFSDDFLAPTCKAGVGNCNSNGITLENGFTNALAVGLKNFSSIIPLQGYDPYIKTPYTMDYNLTIEHSISTNLVASAGYVASASRHLQVQIQPNSAAALLNPASNIQSVRPFPGLGNGPLTSAVAESSYNSLQTRLEKRYANGLDFLATYTWSHSLDDAPTALTSDTGFPNTNLVPINYDYSNSVFDVRHRFTFNGFYQLPFGKGYSHMNRGGIANVVAGGWASNVTFVAQTGEPFTVTPDISTAAGITARAIKIRDPFAPGGTPDPSNPIPQSSCATHTRILLHWYNPCAFANPLPGTNIPASGKGSQVTDPSQVLAYLGGKRNTVEGPGYERVNMSVFKNFSSYHEQYAQFRVDIFNVLNTPAYGTPSITTNDSNGGEITAPQSFQNFTPDARFFQLSLKYIF